MLASPVYLAPRDIEYSVWSKSLRIEKGEKRSRERDITPMLDPNVSSAAAPSETWKSLTNDRRSPTNYT